ncbi:MAG: hypothetical protein ABJO02_03355 [Reichenbachiella sp.]|uniref:hypothetical protein n=1 Tax=Reichenbachiella sp. TaxID=2184521 RepID=UPI003298F64C
MLTKLLTNTVFLAGCQLLWVNVIVPFVDQWFEKQLPEQNKKSEEEISGIKKSYEDAVTD